MNRSVCSLLSRNPTVYPTKLPSNYPTHPSYAIFPTKPSALSKFDQIFDQLIPDLENVTICLPIVTL